MDDRINRAPVDRFTLLHVAAGMAAGAVRLPWWLTLVGSLAFEVMENGIQPDVPSIFAGSAPSDSLPNSVADTIAVMLGWAAVDVGRSVWRGGRK